MHRIDRVENFDGLADETVNDGGDAANKIGRCPIIWFDDEQLGSTWTTQPFVIVDQPMI